MAAKSYEELMAENHRKQKQLKEEEKDLKKKHAEELKKKRIARHIKIPASFSSPRKRAHLQTGGARLYPELKLGSCAATRCFG